MQNFALTLLHLCVDVLAVVFIILSQLCVVFSTALYLILFSVFRLSPIDTAKLTPDSAVELHLFVKII